MGPRLVWKISILVLLTISHLLSPVGNSRQSEIKHFNKFRRTIKDAANLPELTYDEEMEKHIRKRLKDCRDPNEHYEDTKAYGKTHLLAFMTDEKLEHKPAKLLVHFAKEGKAGFDKKKLICKKSMLHFCKDYFMLAYSKATIAACVEKTCKVHGKEQNIVACAIGPKPHSFTDPKEPAYIKGKQCSECPEKFFCRKKLCASNTERFVDGASQLRAPGGLLLLLVAICVIRAVALG